MQIWRIFEQRVVTRSHFGVACHHALAFTILDCAIRRVAGEKGIDITRVVRDELRFNGIERDSTRR